MFILNKRLLKVCVWVFLCLFGLYGPLMAEDHIKELDSIRSSIIEQGNEMPDLIKNADDNEIRTLERIYELNTSLLTTIEAYFKMLKVIISSEVEINKEVIDPLNEWLQFIHNQCKYDIEYLDEALSESKKSTVIKQIRIARENIERVSTVTELGITENNALLNSGTN